VDELVSLVTWAAGEGIGLLPVGTRGASVPPSDTRPFVRVSVRRLAAIEIYEAADLTITLGAGARVGQLESHLAGERQWLPLDPPHGSEGTVGGLLARGFSGALWAGYGELRNHVLGVKVVTGDGRTLRLGGRVVKNVAGFDLLKPMIGSRGRLGIIVSACLRVHPIPEADRVLLARGHGVETLVALALRVGTAPVMPASVVVVDALGPDGSAALLVRLHGAEAAVDADHARLEAHLGTSLERGSDADSVAARSHACGDPLEWHVSVRPSRLSKALEALGGLAPTAIWIDTYAARIRLGADLVDAEQADKAARAVASLGGSLSLARGPRAEIARVGSSESDAVLGLMQGLYRAFDPQDVLWPSR
jgi:glycolate oxidase FAD binding subunit